MLRRLAPGTIEAPGTFRNDAAVKQRGGRTYKVALFLPSLGGGGAERAMLVFAEGLLALGVEVDLLIGRNFGMLHSFIPPGAGVRYLGRQRMFSSVLPLARYLRRERPDALYSTICHANVSAVIAHVLAGRPGRLVLRESNGPLSEEKSGLRRNLVHQASRMLYLHADGIIAVSQGVADELVLMDARLKGRIHVLPTPVISPRLMANDAIPHPWFHDGQIPIIIGAGRLQKQKDFSTLIQAFAMVRKVKPCRLLILGQGPLRHELEAQIERCGLKKVAALPGFVDNPFPWFRRASVFVLSSRWEGMPNVLLQAMACGTPVVATDCPSGPRECLKDGAYGTLVPVSDAAQLAEAILAALRSPRRADAAAAVLLEHDAVHAARCYLEVAGLKVQEQGSAALELAAGGEGAPVF